MTLQRFALVCLAFTAAHPGSVTAQTVNQLMNRGLQEYQDFNYEQARDLLGQATDQLDKRSEDYRRVAPYLAASYQFLGKPDSAAVTFTDLLIHNPRYRIDELTFPPQVWALFESVRRNTTAVDVEVPPQATILVNQNGMLTARAFVTARHYVLAEIQNSIGSRLTSLYRGWITDSLDLQWTPRNASGQPVPNGRYFLSVTSTDSIRREVRSVRIPLDVNLARTDTLAHPPPPSDSLFLPVRAPQLSGNMALLRGFGAAAAVFLGPAIVTSGATFTAPRIGVSLAAGLFGFLGLKSPPLGEPLPQNVDANQALVTSWENEVARIVDANQRRISNARMTIRSGPPQITSPAGL